ncbi:hypothetical protein H5S09_01915 [Limosilactobacillus sp. STM2_1]|uniref:Uncharacterized protein n=1 Tax=Limosilactobacillus rudii TaxID=2759755 RepID=A0A7W3UJI0_9LACO|nr:hypothetical protein [Limosilactobacillus rudii]MBB1078720.1 hypothetical protein [Limosilactobacillus rudii]MBB1096712.1 hypothetical protein [Limosilactobacillus rudii]MCD7135616.1 hypothetical protein [Limosilactobacillus rudii]
MNKEHGQVTGLIWRGATDLAIYQQLKEYAENKNVSVAVAAKQLISQALKQN